MPYNPHQSLENWDLGKFMENVVNAGKTGATAAAATGNPATGGLTALAKLFWDEIGHKIAAEVGKEGLKLAWEKFVSGQKPNELKEWELPESKDISKLNEIKDLKDRLDTLKYSQERLEKKKKDKNKKWDRADQEMYNQQKKELEGVEKKLTDYYVKHPQLKANFEEEYPKLMKDLQQKREVAIKKAEEAIKPTQPAQLTPDQQRFQQYSPEQSQVLNRLSQLGLQGLESNKFDFEPIAQQARQRFSSQTLPSISQRFAAHNLDKSSAFPRLLGRSVSDFESNLEALRQQYNDRQQQHYANIAQIGLRSQYGYGGPLITGLNQQQQQPNIDKFLDYAFTPDQTGSTPIGRFFSGTMNAFGSKNTEGNNTTQQAAAPVQQAATPVQTSMQQPNTRQAMEMMNPNAFPPSSSLQQDLSNIGSGMYGVGSKGLSGLANVGASAASGLYKGAQAAGSGLYSGAQYAGSGAQSALDFIRQRYGI